MAVTTQLAPGSFATTLKEELPHSLGYPCYAQYSPDILSFVLTISRKFCARVANRTDSPLLLAQSRIGSGLNQGSSKIWSNTERELS
jgi:hypothetical protein